MADLRSRQGRRELQMGVATLRDTTLASCFCRLLAQFLAGISLCCICASLRSSRQIRKEAGALVVGQGVTLAFSHPIRQLYSFLACALYF